MENLIVLAVIILIMGLAIAYIVKEKKKGVKCVGCPAATECAKKRAATANGCPSNEK